MISTEIFSKWNTSEIFAPGTVVEGDVVENKDENEEDNYDTDEAHDNGERSSGSSMDRSVIGNVRHQSIGQKEPGDKSNYMSIIVYPGQEAQAEKYEEYCQ